MIIVCELDNFEIENSFCVDNKALEMLKVLSPISEIVVDKNFIIKSKKGSSPRVSFNLNNAPAFPSGVSSL